MLLAIVTLLACPLFLFIYFELKYYRHKRALSVLPGAPTLPILGNAHQVGNTPEDILNSMFGWFYQFNRKNFRVWIAYIPNIVIVEPKDFEFILSSTTLINKSYVYEITHPWLGLGLLNSTGRKWRLRRKLITPSFHFKILQDFHEVMNIHSNKFVQQLKRVSAGGTIFDLQELVHYFTLDVICDTAMGVSINAMEKNDSEYVAAIKYMTENIQLRAFHPWKNSNRFYRLASEYPEYMRNLKVLRDFTNNIIAERIRSRNVDVVPEIENEGNTTRRKLAFLDTLLSSTIEGRPLNQEELYEEVSTFMFEGHDTTTSGVTFAIYLLSRHPRIQKKVYEEQLLILGGSTKRDASFQELADMKYLDLFIKETQRIYPSVPIVAREADQDYNMNGLFIPKGTNLNLAFMMLGYNERIFKDAHICRPERFETEKPGPFEYLPFSAGLRNCVGQKFALLEMKSVLSKIVRTFEILPPLPELVSNDDHVTPFFKDNLKNPGGNMSKPHKYDPIMSAVLTLKSANGIHLRMKERIK